MPNAFSRGPLTDGDRSLFRVTGGASGLAMCLYLLVKAQKDGDIGDLLAHPLTFQEFPVLFWLGVWSLLLLVSVPRFVIGASAVGTRRDMMDFLCALATAAAVGGLWLVGAFFPPNWTLAETVNLGLGCLYVYVITGAVVGAVVSLIQVSPVGLPEPADNPDNIIAGPASPEKAHTALGGKSGGDELPRIKTWW